MRVAAIGDVSEVIMGQAPKGDTYNETCLGLPLIAGASDFGATYPHPSRYTSAPGKISSTASAIGISHRDASTSAA